ncbi:major capsid protein [Bradyrhizobium sp. 180]|uniref:major capsid protein n=1 Tax=unclassified Bradyrhizobium TaxID=2631580 RepID=UPI001FFBEE15|nr:MULTISPECIES: major capsid protein [unclassified Bradyrhizobium]MCK1494452.1 major capsid protein [Bradyrhizobium sp. 180]MCK1593785.1 major capsid protein [Bradyrhizobium sp. 164]
MPNEIADPFSGDAFELSSLTAAINDVDHIPGRAGQLVFADSKVSKPISTLSIAIERVGETLELIQTRPRGAPAEKLVGDRRTLHSFKVPHLQVEDTIYTESVQSVRQFGSADVLLTVEAKLNEVLTKMSRRLDYTLENHRLGALKGVTTDADGSVLLDSYEAFGFLNSDGLAQPQTFDFDLDSLATGPSEIRVKCQGLARYMRRAAKTLLTQDALVWAFVGDNFFDKLVSRQDVKDAWIGTEAAATVLGANYAYGVFEFGGVLWENYRGSDNGEIFIDPDEARFFFVNAPQLYVEAFAPADYIETVNTPGLPKYAKSAPDRMGKSMEIEAQSNPLPLCVQPATLCRAVTGSSS